MTLAHLHGGRLAWALTAIARAAAAASRFAHVAHLLAHHDFVHRHRNVVVGVAEAAARLGEHDRAAAWLRTAEL